MDDFNPYAAPVTDLSTPRDPADVGVWRDGDVLVMAKAATLPDRCLKCNEKADGWTLKRNLSWHAPGWYVLAISPLIYIIAAMIVRKTAKVRVPLCREHRRRRNRAILIGWLLGLLGFVSFFVGAGAGPDLSGPIMIAAGITLFAGLIVGVVGAQVAPPKRIDKRYVWLTKVNPQFLNELPPWTTV